MPDVTGVHIPQALNNFSLFYRNPSYVAGVFAPKMPVSKESDKYYIYGKEHFQIGPAKRADKALTQEITYSLSTDTYFCEEYGYHEMISDRERGNADDVLSMDIDTTEHLVETLTLDKEYQIANMILSATNPQWGSFASTHIINLAAAWADPSNADPRTNIYYAKKIVFKDARKPANRIGIPTDVAFALALVDNLDELRKYTDPNLLTDSGIPAKFFGLEVSECQSSYNASPDGEADNMLSTWGNNVVVAYVAPNGLGRKTLTFAATFTSRDFRVRKWREEPRESDCIEATHCFDSKIVAPACGFVFLNAI
jgi:hypothetical protein